MRLQHLAPLGRKLHAVALRTRTPHRRAFGFVQHPKLHHRVVGHDARIAAQGIHLAHDLTLGHAAHGGVATHLRDGLHVHGGQHDLAPEVGGGYRCLASGMAGTDYYDIVGWKHLYSFEF